MFNLLIRWPVLLLMMSMLLGIMSFSDWKSVHAETRTDNLPARGSSAKDQIQPFAQFGGATNAVVAQDNYVYLGVGTRLQILDITQPTTPVLIGVSAPLDNIIEDIAISDHHAYLAIGDRGIVVLDIKDLTHPRILVQLFLGTSLVNLAIEGQDLYIAGYGYLQILDVTEPARPVHLSSLKLAPTTGDLSVKGGYVYVATNDSGLQIVDVRDRLNPQVVSVYRTPNSYIHDVTLVEHYAYLATSGSHVLQIVDVSDPAKPRLVGSFDQPYTQGTTIAVKGQWAYLGNWVDGLHIINITNPQIPFEVAKIDMFRYANDVVVYNNLLFVSYWDVGLQIFDITHPDQPDEINLYDDGLGNVSKVVVEGKHIYVGTERNGLYIMDIANPRQPVEIGHYPTKSGVRSIKIHNQLAYLGLGGDLDAGLHILDITQPVSPTLVGFYTATQGWVTDLEVQGNYAYLADGGLRVIDVSTPTAPREVGKWELSGKWANSVAVTGQFAYVGVMSGVLWVIDITDPTKPKKLSEYHLPTVGEGIQNIVQAIAVKDTIVFAASEKDGLLVLDLSNPLRPTQVALYGFHSNVTDLLIQDNYLYFTQWSSGVTILDITNPLTPQIVAEYYDYIYAQGIAVYDNLLLVAAYTEGLVTYIFNPNEHLYLPIVLQ